MAGFDVQIDVVTKTDWVASDYYSLSDWLRWVSNIRFLMEEKSDVFTNESTSNIDELLNNIEYTSKTLWSVPYAQEWTLLETCLQDINNLSYKLQWIPNRYFDNSPVPNYEDFNRIENFMLELDTKFKADRDAIDRLAFTLGNQKGVKE